MIPRIFSCGVIAGIAGSAMLLATCAPSAAFTLSSPSLEQPVAAAGVENVWWGRGGGWRRNGWGWRGRWGGGWRGGWGWHRPVGRCWGHWRCW